MSQLLAHAPSSAVCLLIMTLTRVAAPHPARPEPGLVADRPSNELPSWVKSTRCTAGVSHTPPPPPTPPAEHETAESLEPAAAAPHDESHLTDFAPHSDGNEIDGDVDSPTAAPTDPPKPYRAPSPPTAPPHYLDDE